MQCKAIKSIYIAQMHIELNAHVIGLAFKLVAGAQFASFSLTNILHRMLGRTSTVFHLYCELWGFQNGAGR